ncbi:MAG: ATP-binding protein [Myxococcota bacterium]
MTVSRILLVEDNQELAENLVEVFELDGYQVQVSPSGTRALQHAQQGFDLAILDVRLPDMLGTALLPRLKEQCPESEAIVTTGNADLESAVQAVRGGAFAYLIKPVGMEELRLTVARALDRVHLRRSSRQLQEALESSERRLRAIVDTVQALMVALDRQSRVRFANRALEAITGYKREEILGRDYFEIFAPPNQREHRRQRVLEAFAGKALEWEVDMVCKDGSVRRVQVRWSRQVQQDEDLIYGMGLDVTAQRELERRARVSDKLAAVGTLTAGLAHEIRNPLNAAMLQLSLLARRISKLPDDDRVPLDEPLRLVQDELGRLNGLLGDFLAFARPREYRRAPVDLSTLTREVVALNLELSRDRNVDLRAQVEDGVFCTGDPDALRGAVVNLVKNALEACKGRVSVDLHRDGSRAVLLVEDDGGGIPPEVTVRLFEPFFTTKSSGTGLGLPMVYTVVTGHGGDISLQNRDGGGGALARVSLPLG